MQILSLQFVFEVSRYTDVSGEEYYARGMRVASDEVGGNPAGVLCTI